jgi:hypothetical protein
MRIASDEALLCKKQFLVPDGTTEASTVVGWENVFDPVRISFLRLRFVLTKLNVTNDKEKSSEKLKCNYSFRRVQLSRQG